VSDIEDPVEAGDDELWRRAQGGESECFGVLFDRYADSVRAYCARRTGNLDDVDDLVSIVFLEAWRRREDVELVHGAALPWLYGIARRTIQRRWRTTARHRRALQRLPGTVLAPDHADEVAGRVDDQRQLAHLQLLFAGLRPADQDVLILCVWQGLGYAAAAVTLGVPVGTVRSRLSRARERLRAGEQALPEATTPRVLARPTPTSTQEQR
jgi:RNA polymerase sigma-70 factor (ECF subfamily)